MAHVEPRSIVFQRMLLVLLVSDYRVDVYVQHSDFPVESVMPAFDVVRGPRTGIPVFDGRRARWFS